MPPKRPQSSVFGEEDDHNATSSSSPTQQKRPRMTPAMFDGSNNAASSSRPPAPPVASGPGSSTQQIDIAAAKARVAAQMAALKSKMAAGSTAATSSTPRPAVPQPAIPAQPPRTAQPASSSIGGAIDIEKIRKQVEEAKRRAAAARGGVNATTSTSSAPSATAAPPPPPPPQSMGLHPLLMSDTVPVVSRGSTGAKGAFAKGNRGVPPAPVEKVNPYLSQPTEDEAGPSKGRSMHRAIQFNRPGRHVEAAKEARDEARMEALKKRIHESAKRAGVGEELTGEERRLRRPPPPDVEWWDAALLPQENYECVPDYPTSSDVLKQLASIENGQPHAEGVAALPLVLGPGTPIDHYIQHPIPIPAPSDKTKVEPKGVMLTKKEMKKMRKQRRAAEQEDKRDRIKMGLQPPDPPKVKLSNLMRVLTSEAVADPTKVEAQVRREVAARKEQHERTNAERQLTAEERKAKIEGQKMKDEAKGVLLCVYKVKHLASPSHKFKVRKNARQHGLTGLCIFNPEFALVVVEGPAKSMKAYKRLMLHRIDWTDPGRPKDGGDDDDDDRDGPSSTPFLGAMGDAPPQARPEDDLSIIDWPQNTCQLIFEGPQRSRVMPPDQPGVRARNAPSDYDAKEVLGEEWRQFWDLAKRVEVAQEEY